MAGEGLVDAIADFFQFAVGAVGFAGVAAATAVPDELMRELDPFFLWDGGH